MGSEGLHAHTGLLETDHSSLAMKHALGFTGKLQQAWYKLIQQLV